MLSNTAFLHAVPMRFNLIVRLFGRFCWPWGRSVPNFDCMILDHDYSAVGRLAIWEQIPPWIFLPSVQGFVRFSVLILPNPLEASRTLTTAENTSRYCQVSLEEGSAIASNWESLFCCWYHSYRLWLCAYHVNESSDVLFNYLEGKEWMKLNLNRAMHLSVMYMNCVCVCVFSLCWVKFYRGK